MTNIEALEAAVNFPIDQKKLEKILLDNGLGKDDLYQGTNKPFELAMASLYVLLVTSANIAEGGFSISATDKGNMIDLAAGIYSKYGLPNPLKPKTTIRNRSNYW